MGRESRQARRQRQRRDAERARKQSSNTSRTGLIAGIAVVVVVIAVIATLVLTQGRALSSPGANATATAVAETTPVAGVAYGPIKCTYATMDSPGFYHVHAHLTILDAGKSIPISNNIGFDLNHDCLTWVHTHTPSYGVLHIESPYKIVPTLGDFFGVWGKPLNSTQVASATVKPGQHMKVFVDEKPYTGDPRKIKLVRHEDIEIEVGPPFVKPKKFNYNQFNPPL